MERVGHLQRGAGTDVPSPEGTWPAGVTAGPPASSCMLSRGWDSSKQLSELLTFGKWEPFQALGTVSTWHEGMQTGLGRQGQEQSDLSLSTTAFLITPCIVSQHQPVTQRQKSAGTGFVTIPAAGPPFSPKSRAPIHWSTSLRAC